MDSAGVAYTEVAQIHIINASDDTIWATIATNATGGFAVDMTTGLWLFDASDDGNYSAGADARWVNVSN